MLQEFSPLASTCLFALRFSDDCPVLRKYSSVQVINLLLLFSFSGICSRAQIACRWAETGRVTRKCTLVSRILSFRQELSPLSPPHAPVSPSTPLSPSFGPFSRNFFYPPFSPAWRFIFISHPLFEFVGISVSFWTRISVTIPCREPQMQTVCARLCIIRFFGGNENRIDSRGRIGIVNSDIFCRMSCSFSVRIGTYGKRGKLQLETERQTYLFRA